MVNDVKKNLPIAYIVITAVIMLAACIVENVNGRFWLYDFQVYYKAAQAIMHGQQVYGVAFALGSGYFKYSPFTALLYIPFSLLPYKLACLMQFGIISFACIYTLLLVFNLLNDYLFKDSLFRKANAILITVFVCFIIHIVRELHLGNINFLLLLLLTMSLKYILKEKFLLASLLIALVLITKPFFVLLCVPLVLHKYYKVVLFTAGFTLLFILIPAVFIGFNNDIALHKQWFDTMITHADVFPSANTLDAIISKYLYRGNQYMPYLIIAAVYMVYVVLFYFRKGNKSPQNLKSNLIVEWFLLIALMPTLFRTDTQHFLLSAPLIAIICCYLYKSKNITYIVIFSVLIIMYDTNSTDLMGRALSDRVNQMGVLGISNILIVIMALITYFKKIRSEAIS